jgi:transcriptional regulator with XRE-family HTH domain
MNNDPKPKMNCNDISRAFRDFILEAPDEELPELSEAFGESSEALLKKGKSARDRALSGMRQDGLQETGDSNQARQQVGIGALRHGFKTVLQLLCRRDGLDEQDLARSAKVDVNEICRIEADPNYMPSPRTIFQLEQVFRLPVGILAKLSGVVRFSDEAVEKEVLEFATSAKSIGKLTSEERKLLNSFVKFLADRG